MPSRRFLITLLLLISVFFAFTFGTSVSRSGDDWASSATAGPEEVIASAYKTVLEAEEAGADIVDLAARLNDACGLIVQAEILRNAGRLDEASRLSNLSVEIGGEVAREAIVLRDSATMQAEWNFRVTLALSASSVALIACTSLLGWRAFKRRYYRQVLPREVPSDSR